MPAVNCALLTSWSLHTTGKRRFKGPFFKSITSHYMLNYSHWFLLQEQLL